MISLFFFVNAVTDAAVDGDDGNDDDAARPAIIVYKRPY